MKPVLVLLSGGIDSSVCLLKYVDEGRPVRALTVSFGGLETNDPETLCAQELTKQLSVPHVTVDASPLLALFSERSDMRLSLGGQLSGCVPSGTIAAPMSVEVMHQMAFMHAIANDIDSVAWAIHLDDFDGQSELSDFHQYQNLLMEMVKLRTGISCSLETPFIERRKHEVIELGETLGLDINRTFSCSSGKKHPCGSCRQCILRSNAIGKAHKKEPLAA